MRTASEAKVENKTFRISSMGPPPQTVFFHANVAKNEKKIAYATKMRLLAEPRSRDLTRFAGSDGGGPQPKREIRDPLSSKTSVNHGSDVLNDRVKGTS